MGLRILFLVNAAAMALAGVVLFAVPGFIPAVAGIALDPTANLLAYLLAASELGFAALCFVASRAIHPEAIAIAVWACIVLHAASGVAGILAYEQGLGTPVLWNVALRVAMVVLFLRYGAHTRQAANAHAAGRSRAVD